MRQLAPTTSSRAVDRRTVLRGTGAALAATTLLGGVASARPSNNENVVRTVGEGVDLVGGGDPDLWTEATYHRRSGKPTRLSIWLTGAGLDYLTVPGERHYRLDFPPVDGLNYTFAGIDWNPAGHPPAGVWTVPHFDFHFYFVPEADVNAMTTPSPLPFVGVATYDVPAEQFPRNYVYENPRFIVRNMGEHLYNERTPEFDPDVEFTHTYIYGAYDPSIDLSNPSGTVTLPIGPGGTDVTLPTYEGDGAGELTFTEPMITEAFLRSDSFHRGGPVNVRVDTPEAFPVAGYYPTRYVMRYDAATDRYEIALDGMKWFEAA